MKELFKNKNGWISFAIIVITIVIIGFTRFLTKNLNVTLILLLAVSAVAVFFFHRGEKEEKLTETLTDETPEEAAQAAEEAKAFAERAEKDKSAEQ